MSPEAVVLWAVLVMLATSTVWWVVESVATVLTLRATRRELLRRWGP